MSQTIPAVYRGGAFYPLQPVDLPEGARAEVTTAGDSSSSTATEPARGNGWPAGYFEQTSGALAGEKFERGPQGESPTRESW